jgi:hypothetical protein
MQKIPLELMDMVLLKLHNLEVIAVFNRKWIGKKISQYKWIPLLLYASTCHNKLNTIIFIYKLRIPTDIILKAMHYACIYGNLDVVKYLYYIESDKINTSLDMLIKDSCKECNLSIIEFFYSIGKLPSIEAIIATLIYDKTGDVTKFLFDNDLIETERLEWTNKWGNTKVCCVKDIHKFIGGFGGNTNIKWI